MNHMRPRERDFAVDLESGWTTDEVGSTDPVLGAKLAKTFFTKVCSGLVGVDGSVKGEKGVSLSSNMSNGRKVSQENVKLLKDKKLEGEEAVDIEKKRPGNEKRKTISPKKPPRPPRGPSLDPADQKLIKEISELVMIKRARIERMKALKKMKAVKSSSSSSNGNLFAMLFTILFCLVIIFQGMSSRSSPISLQGSPDLARGTEGGFISLRYHWLPSATDTSIPGSGPSNLLEQVFG